MKLLEVQWQMLKELTSLLKKAYKTVKLQYANCTPSYFYSKWSGLKLYYEQHGWSLRLAEEISEAMSRRELSLMQGMAI